MSNTIKIDAADLAGEVAWMARMKTGAVPVPALKALEVAAVVGALRLRRTDYELFTESAIPATGGGQARVLVDPGALAGLLKGREQGFALVEVGDDHLKLTLGGKTVKLKAAAAVSDFPDWPVFEQVGAAVHVGSGQLERALTSVGTDDKLPFLTGVLFEPGAMASTNRYQLTSISIDTPKDSFTALIPGKALQPFTRHYNVVRVAHGHFAGDNDKAAVQISSGGRSVIVVPLDCEFPKWRLLIPAEDTLTVRAVLYRDELLDAISASPMLIGGNVTLTLTEDAMTVLGSDRGAGIEIEQRITAEAPEGQLPFTVALNAAYLAGCVKGISGGVVRFGATTPTRPVLLRGVDDEDVHLVMPVGMPS